MEYIKPIFEVEEDLELTEELLSIHSINPFIANMSSPRSVMMSSHLSQIITLNNGEEKIIQTGLEKQLGRNTFSRKFENDARIITIINRYGGVSSDEVTATPELLVIFEDLDTGKIDCMEIPYYHSLHQYFGFKYKRNEEELSSLYTDAIVPKDTILADSPTVTTNGGYKFGVNANTAMLTLPETVEDGFIISKSFAEKLEYNIFERRSIEFGADAFPLNLYGDDENYKPFPDIGEYVNDDSILMALREYNPDLATSLLSARDVQSVDTMFDECVYVKGPKGKVVDIKAYNNPRFKKDVYKGTSNLVDKYVNGLIKYNEEIIRVYESLRDDHYKRSRNYDLDISEKFHKIILDAYVIANPNNNKLTKIYKSDKMDIYRVEITIQYTVKPYVGGKLTDLSGGKGVAVTIWDDDDMPVDKYGNRADIIIDPTSITSRMNISRMYEQYFNSVSRHTKVMVVNKLLSIDKNMDMIELIDTLNAHRTIEVFDIVLGLLEIIGTEQYVGYLELKKNNDIINIKHILKEIVEKELFIYYKVSSELKGYQIVTKLRETKYATPLSKIYFNHDGTTKESVTDMFIAPLYFILLFKTGDEYLSVASAKVNHFNFPIGNNKRSKTRTPYSPSPTKVVSETEGRIYTAYGSRFAMAELKDRANNIDTHKMIYKKLLTADKPTNIDKLVDRSEVPYGGDAAINLIDSIFNAFGLELTYE